MTCAIVNGVVFASYKFFAKIQTGSAIPSDELLLPNLTQIFLAGVGSGIVSSIVTTPTELIKIQQQNRVMIDSRGVQSAREVLKHVLATQGFQGLFRGLGATALRDCGYGVYFFTVRFAMVFVNCSHLIFWLVWGSLAIFPISNGRGQSRRVRSRFCHTFAYCWRLCRDHWMGSHVPTWCSKDADAKSGLCRITKCQDAFLWAYRAIGHQWSSIHVKQASLSVDMVNYCPLISSRRYSRILQRIRSHRIKVHQNIYHWSQRLTTALFQSHSCKYGHIWSIRACCESGILIASSLNQM